MPMRERNVQGAESGNEHLPPSPCTQGEGWGEGTSAKQAIIGFQVRHETRAGSTLSPALSLRTGRGRARLHALATARLVISCLARSMNDWTGIAPLSPPVRVRTATALDATSFSPTISMYGIFSMVAERILAPIFSPER